MLSYKHIIIMSIENCYIIIDCPPGSKRADSIFNDILSKTNLTINDFINISNTFGECKFQLQNENKIDDYIANIPIFQKELTSYYLNSSIRYAEWSPNT